MANIKSLIAAALNAASAYGRAVGGLQTLPEVKTAARKGPEPLRTLLLPHVAAFYGVGVVISESPRNAGALTLDRGAARYEAAKTALRRLVTDVMGKGSGQADDVEVPAELLAAAAKLARLAREYENARSLAAKALAAAW